MSDQTDPIYVLLPGEVTSINDGQRHQISSRQLISCYKVPAHLCVVYESSKVDAQGSLYHKPNRWKLEQLTPLAPDFYGVYKIPEGKLNEESLASFDRAADRADEWLKAQAQEKERLKKEKLAESAKVVEVGKIAGWPVEVDKKTPWPFPVVHGKIPD